MDDENLLGRDQISNSFPSMKELKARSKVNFATKAKAKSVRLTLSVCSCSPFICTTQHSSTTHVKVMNVAQDFFLLEMRNPNLIISLTSRLCCLWSVTAVLGVCGCFAICNYCAKVSGKQSKAISAFSQ